MHITKNQESMLINSENQPELTLDLFKKHSKQSLMKERKNSNQFHRCLICSDIATFPVECQKCKAIFCKKCAQKWEQQSFSCPQKCSKVWNYFQIQSSQIKLKCPYNSQCEQILFPQCYQAHLSTCLYTPPTIKYQISLKNNFKCDLNHSLILINGVFQQLINLPCHKCNSFKLCRCQCPQCNTMYCIQCRPLPFVKQRCWNKKHKYVFVKSDSDAVCDVCATKPYEFYLGSYQDKACNTTICQICYQKLPIQSNIF